MSGNRPLIGITCYRDEASWSVWKQPAALIPQTYVDAVEQAGGTPVVLPPQHGGNAAALLGALDGLVLAGGADIDPERYHAAPHPRTGAPQRARDSWEFELLTGALETDLPVLGVCRGMQLMNVALGGDLIQHLPEDSHQTVPARFVRHEVRIDADSRVGAILGDSAKVNCYHHQAVGRIGEGLTPVARAEDGTVEALELPDRRFALGVQWHPETDLEDLRLFRALTDTANEKNARSRT